MNAGKYPEPIASDMRQAAERIRFLNETLRNMSAMVNRAMDERKVILNQTQQLHIQLLHYRKREFQMRQYLHQIGILSLSASQSEFAADNSSGQTATTSTTSESQSNLILSIHTGAGVCPAGSIRWEDLRRVVKKDRNGTDSECVICPNCEASFLDRKAGKECGLREHLTKLKCPKLKHLRPDAGDGDTGTRKSDQKRTGESDVPIGKEKKKKTTAVTQKKRAETATSSSIAHELDDLVVHVTTPPGLSPSSMSNILQVQNEF